MEISDGEPIDEEGSDALLTLDLLLPLRLKAPPTPAVANNVLLRVDEGADADAEGEAPKAVPATQSANVGATVMGLDAATLVVAWT